MKIELSRQIFRNYSNIKFHENSPVGIRVVPCGRTDMTELIIEVAFRNFANAPQNNTKANVVPGTVFIPWHRRQCLGLLQSAQLRPVLT